MKRNRFYLIVLVFFMILNACNNHQTAEKKEPVTDTIAVKKQIASLLDSFNAKAAAADYNAYFNYFSKDAVFIGTDATEYWNKAAFEIWAKPYFDKKTTWNFKVIQRNIYLADKSNIAWFDELLNTSMKICRGSGVLVKQNNEWKIQQYVLSTTIPNSKLDQVVAIKAAEEEALIQSIQK